jgi:hypothetical protein
LGKTCTSEFFKDDQNCTSPKDECNLKCLKTHDRASARFSKFHEKPYYYYLLMTYLKKLCSHVHACRYHAKKMCQRSAKCRRFTPVSSHMKYGHLDRVVLDEVKLTPPPSLCSMIKHESEGGYQRRPRKTIHSNVGIKPE